MNGLFGALRTTPGEIGCLDAIVYTLLFAGAMLGMVWLIASQLELTP